MIELVDFDGDDRWAGSVCPRVGVVLPRQATRLLRQYALTCEQTEPAAPAQTCSAGTKVVQCGLADLFQRIEIVSEKDPTTYRRVLDEFSLQPGPFAMVGNSLRSDIAPMVGLGGWGVYMPYHITWTLEVETDSNEDSAHVVRVDAAAVIGAPLPSWTGARRPDAQTALQSRSRTGYKRRMKVVDTLTPCPCGNTDDYAHCCGPLHDGTAAATVVALMRSRYSAYVLKREDYLLATWHASTRPASLRLSAQQPAPTRLGLELRRHDADDAEHAIVEFVARYRRGGGRAQRLHEISRFVREDGRWYYVDGEVRA